MTVVPVPIIPFNPKPLPPSYSSIIDLAIPDGPATAEESLNPFCSKLGGEAALLYPLASSVLECPLCGAEMFLILQMDCPREEWPGIDRIAYIFGCNRRSCSQQPKGWKVLFQCRLTGPEQTVPLKNDCSFWDSLMSEEDKQFDNSTKLMKPSSSKTTTATTNFKRDHKNCFPPIFLHIEEELIVEKKSSSKTAPLSQVSMTDDNPNATDEWSGEQYEKFRVPGADASFTRFQKRVAHYPRQCVRFTVAAGCRQEDGSASSKQPITALPFKDCNWGEEMDRLPGCSGCGRRLSHFELQLMPAILAFLPTEAEAHLKHINPSQRSTNPLISDGMEWGTVMVFTCAHCGPVEQSYGAVMIQLE